MKVKEKEHSYIITKVTDSIEDFIHKIENQYTTYKSRHLILDLGNHADVADLILFEPLSQQHKSNKKSIVLIVKDTEFTEFENEYVTVVPTIQEAYDIIEMEEIERDLEF